jgi:hypothetical protein
MGSLPKILLVAVQGCSTTIVIIEPASSPPSKLSPDPAE